MPYYRILIWTKERPKPYRGIRQMESHQIDVIYSQVRKKAENTYYSKLLDVEVQMLPRMCTAVQRYMRRIEKRSAL